MLTEAQKKETIQTLIQHADCYPQMEPTDAVKLLYQNEFAGGHLITDESACINWLKQECDSVQPLARAAESLGNGIVRIHLSDVKQKGYSLRSIARCFMNTARTHQGNQTAFREKLELLNRLTQTGEFSFTNDTFQTYLKRYIETGCPPVRHSPVFRQCYHPAYRVINERYIRLLPLIKSVDDLLKKQNRVVLAIDGRCASGKTTAAEMLAFLWNAPVVHMDDFFLPSELRTSERLNEPGGNVHYERFQDEVLPGLRVGGQISYRKFDCSTLQYSEVIHIPPSSVVIVEGAYCLHPRFGDYADQSVFFHITPDEQIQRIKERNGLEMAKLFQDKWIPMEEKYFSEFELQKKVNLMI
ncbi:MAG: uridine kinase family protein [Oscillospiraceae bacterium]|jgi:uridine kinase